MFPDMSTPPGSTPPGAPSAGADAAAIAKGALTGGTAGAVKAAVKTGVGRKLLLLIPALPVVAVACVIGLAANATSNVNTLDAGHKAMAQQIAVTDFGNNADLAAIQDAGVMTGTPWEVLAAIVKIESGRSGPDKGTGPFGIDMAAAGGAITPEDAADLHKAAVFVGNRLSQAFQGTVSTLNNRSMDAGYEDTVRNGTTVRQASTRPELQAMQAEIQKQYTAAIAALPIKGNPAVAGPIYTYAQNWANGQQGSGGCFGGTAILGGQTTADLNESQKQYAQQIINATAAKGMPQAAAVVALMTALQESTLRMYWNGKVPGSHEIAPPDGPEGSDGYSVGLFQQQVHGSDYSWGTVEDAMDPARSSGMFLDRLAKVNGWQDMPRTVAAQTVQVSAFPEAYAKWQSVAETLVHDLKPTGGANYSDASGAATASPSPSATGTSTATPTASPNASPAAAPVSNSCHAGTGTGTTGKGDDYPYKNPVGACAWCSNVDADGAVDPWTLYKRECVSFVSWRMNVQMGWKEGDEYPFTPAKLGLDLFGNAAQWKNTVGSKFTMDNTPKVGAVAWFDANIHTPSTITGDAGHVAVVSGVNSDGTVDIEEYNFTPWAYGTRTIPVADVTKFIHVADIDPSASPTPTSTTKGSTTSD